MKKTIIRLIKITEELAKKNNLNFKIYSHGIQFEYLELTNNQDQIILIRRHMKGNSLNIISLLLEFQEKLLEIDIQEFL